MRPRPQGVHSADAFQAHARPGDPRRRFASCRSRLLAVLSAPSHDQSRDYRPGPGRARQGHRGRCLPGARTGHGGGRGGLGMARRRDEAHRPSAGQSWKLFPARAGGEHHAGRGEVEPLLRHAARCRHAEIPRRRRLLDRALQDPGRARERRAAGFRRLWRGRAGIQLERLCRRGREGEDGRHPHQRSRQRRRQSRSEILQGQGDDLLRPLDLQIRRGGASGGRCGHHRA